MAENKCRYRLFWRTCPNPPKKDHKFCAEHAKEKCRCGQPAIRECEAQMGLLCGEPLCATCQHVGW